MLIGLHARDDIFFQPADFEVIKQAKIQSLKTMSFTDVGEYRKVRAINPTMQFIVRLHHKMEPGGPGGKGSMPTPAAFAEVNRERLNTLHSQLGIVKFEIHNEPNIEKGKEGWGPEREEAEKFLIWYEAALKLLRQNHPWGKFGFPGLALKMNDDLWLDWCRSGIEKSDWLGCHIYWQSPDNRKMWEDPEFGLRFQRYHDKYPTMPIEITEYGNSNGKAMPISAEERANQYVAWLALARQNPKIQSAHAFISSSPFATWHENGFAWASPNGEILQPLVNAIAGVKHG